MIKNTILFAFLSILLSCTDHEDLYDRDYPLLKTLPSENISSYGATFSAAMVGERQFPAEEFGFIWNTTGYQSKTGSQWRSLGSTEELSDFSLEISKALEENETYYVMAYAVYDKKTIYGNVERFKSTPAPKPELKKLIPTAGIWGDTIKVIGKDFSYIKEKNTVLFGTIASKILEINDTTLKVIVPATLKESISPVTAVVSTQKSEPLSFTLKKPVLTSSSKMEITVCDTITVTGENLPPQLTELSFNDKSSKIIKKTSNTYQVAVPFFPSTTTTIALSIFYNNEKFTLYTPLTFKPAKLLSVSPASASFLDTLTLNLQNIPCEVQAQFGSIKVNLIEKTSDYIKIVVPASYSVSPMQIQLLQGSNTILTTSITRKLKIISITPAVANINDIITLKGEGFNPAGGNSITIYGRSITPLSVTKNEIKFKFSEFNTPILNGVVSVTLTIAGQSVTGQFSMTPAKVTSITASSDPITVGTIITVTGENFSTYTANNTLRNPFTNKLFTPLSATPTRLTFQADHNSLPLVKYDAIKYSTNFDFSSVSYEFRTSSFNIDYKGMWTDRPDFPGEARVGAITLSLGTNLYFGLGIASGTKLKDFWKYNTTSNTWTQLADFPGDARDNAMSWTLNSMGYVGCGRNSSNTALKDIWSFNSTTQTWTQLNDYPGSVAIPPKAYTLDTQGYATSQLEFWQFNASNGTWTQKNNLSYSIVSAGTGNYNLYAALLTTPPQTQVLYRYNPSTDSWMLWESILYYGKWLAGVNKLYLLNYDYKSIIEYRDLKGWVTTPYAGPEGSGTVYSFASGTKVYILIGKKISEWETIKPAS